MDIGSSKFFIKWVELSAKAIQQVMGDFIKELHHIWL